MIKQTSKVVYLCNGRRWRLRRGNVQSDGLGILLSLSIKRYTWVSYRTASDYRSKRGMRLIRPWNRPSMVVVVSWISHGPAVCGLARGYGRKVLHTEHGMLQYTQA